MSRMDSAQKKPLILVLASTAVVYVWSLVFWYLFFILLSVEVLRIPIGLGGALYPLFFSIPVLAITFCYEVIALTVIKNPSKLLQRQRLVTLWLPVAVVSIGLVLFCPMDEQTSYLEYVVTKRF